MRKQRTITLAVVGVTLLAVALCCTYLVSTVLWGARVRRASINFDNGYTLEIWDKYPDYEHWDPDIPYPNMSYRVIQDGNEFIAERDLQMLDIHYQLNLKVTYAANKMLVCVYDEQLWGQGLLIILDKESKTAFDQYGEKGWLTRCDKLLQENPAMPRFPTGQ